MLVEISQTGIFIIIAVRLRRMDGRKHDAPHDEDPIIGAKDLVSHREIDAVLPYSGYRRASTYAPFGSTTLVENEEGYFDSSTQAQYDADGKLKPNLVADAMRSSEAQAFRSGYVAAAGVELFRLAVKRNDHHTIAVLLEQLLTNGRPGTRERVLMQCAMPHQPLIAQLIRSFPEVVADVLNSLELEDVGQERAYLMRLSESTVQTTSQKLFSPHWYGGFALVASISKTNCLSVPVRSPNHTLRAKHEYEVEPERIKSYCWHAFSKKDGMEVMVRQETGKEKGKYHPAHVLRKRENSKIDVVYDIKIQHCAAAQSDCLTWLTWLLGPLRCLRCLRWLFGTHRVEDPPKGPCVDYSSEWHSWESSSVDDSDTNAPFLWRHLADPQHGIACAAHLTRLPCVTNRDVIASIARVKTSPRSSPEHSLLASQHIKCPIDALWYGELFFVRFVCRLVLYFTFLICSGVFCLLVIGHESTHNFVEAIPSLFSGAAKPFLVRTQ